MRLPPLRFALFAASGLALALTATLTAQYVRDSMSAQSYQRRLEADGVKFRDAIRAQRNTPIQRSSSSAWSTPTPPAETKRSPSEYERRRAAEDAQATAWYYARLSAIKEAEAAKAAKIRAVQAEYETLRANRAKSDWDKYRAENNNFTPRSTAPQFPTPVAALAWFLAHDRAAPNPWAAGHAAILLIDGYGVPADPAAAARLLNPHTRREPAGEKPRPELAAIFAYLRARHAEVCVPLGFPADPGAARRDLEALALVPDNALASWYLARLLSESADPSDQIAALQFLPEGYTWMIKRSSRLLLTEFAGSFQVSKPVDATAVAILTRAANHFHVALATWPIAKISVIAGLVTQLPEPQLTAALLPFADAAAERYLIDSPTPKFPYDEFGYLLLEAGRRGSSSAHAIALFERLNLIRFDEKGDYTPTFLKLTDLARPIPSLSRWASRDDALGVRARLALTALAFQIKNPAADAQTPVVLPEPFAAVTAAIQRYRTAAYVDTAHYVALSVTEAAAKASAIKSALQAVQAALARRDASAPPASAMPALLGSLARFQREQDQLAQLNGEPTLITPADPDLFAIAAPSFDLDRAALLFDAAHTSDMIASAAGPNRFAKLHALFEATRLGDAFAPLALSQDPDFRSSSILTSQTRDKLGELSDARRARDEAALRPRALAARVLESNLNALATDPAVVTVAATSGNRFAVRLAFEQRLQASLPTDPRAPASAQLKTALVDEFDATLTSLDAQPPTSTEWQFLGLLMRGNVPVRPVETWFPQVDRWIKDRDDRLAMATLVQALRPSFEALVVTLGEWPGLNHEDARNEDWLTASDQVYQQAEALIATDGIAALTLCLEAAGGGNRDALRLLAYNLRNGIGSLPRAPEFADLLLTAELKISQADAELGDAIAAYNLGLSLMEGDGIAKNPTAGREWLRYAAERGNHDASSELRNYASSDDQPRDPAAERHWSTVGIMIRAGQHIPVPPRRLDPNPIELTPLRPALEAALATARANRATLITKALTDEETNTAYKHYLIANDEARRSPATGLVPLAQLASSGNQAAAFAVAQFLAGGYEGLRPDQPLARRFYALALNLQQANAEFGNADEAYHLGLYHLELADQPDLATALRWLTYAAERGNGSATDTLIELYSLGTPDVPADAQAAARWLAFGQSIRSENFKPRAPLR